jgi:hypothetical protein
MALAYGGGEEGRGRGWKKRDGLSLPGRPRGTMWTRNFFTTKPFEMKFQHFPVIYTTYFIVFPRNDIYTLLLSFTVPGP